MYRIFILPWSRGETAVSQKATLYFRLNSGWLAQLLHRQHGSLWTLLQRTPAGPCQDTARSVGVSVLNESRPVGDLSVLFMVIVRSSLTFLSFKN
jgi:hypothetical protein